MEIAEVIIVEDSGDESDCQTLAHLFLSVGADRPKIRLLCNPQRLGQMRALDRVLAHVMTPWIFHLEVAPASPLQARWAFARMVFVCASLCRVCGEVSHDVSHDVSHELSKLPSNQAQRTKLP